VGVVGGDAKWWCCAVLASYCGKVGPCARVAWGCLDLFLALVFCPDAPERARYVDTPC
jgi:hypothetical protein